MSTIMLNPVRTTISYIGWALGVVGLGWVVLLSTLGLGAASSGPGAGFFIGLSVYVWLMLHVAPKLLKMWAHLPTDNCTESKIRSVCLFSMMILTGLLILPVFLIARETFSLDQIVRLESAFNTRTWSGLIYQWVLPLVCLVCVFWFALGQFIQKKASANMMPWLNMLSHATLIGVGLSLLAMWFGFGRWLAYGLLG